MTDFFLIFLKSLSATNRYISCGSSKLSTSVPLGRYCYGKKWRLTCVRSVISNAAADVRHDERKSAKESVSPDKLPGTERSGATGERQGWRTAAGSNSWPKG